MTRKTSYILIIAPILLFSCNWWDIPPTVAWNCGDPFLDSENQISYQTLLIEGYVEELEQEICQCWMAENINSGNIIPTSQDQSDNDIIERYCDNLGQEEDSCEFFGGLYIWDESMNYQTIEGAQGICPCGWHIPSDEEWKILEIFFGMSRQTADKYDYRDFNSDRFRMMFQPRFSGRTFLDTIQLRRGISYYWTSTLFSYEDSIANSGANFTIPNTGVWMRAFNLNGTSISRNTYQRTNTPYSIRCIKNICGFDKNCQ